MTTYYVDSSAGSDGSGTIGSPWKFLATHINTPVAGDTVLLRGTGARPGRTYSEEINIRASSGANSGTSGSKITIAAYPAEFVRFVAPTDGARSFNFEGVAHWVIDGLDDDYHIECDKNNEHNSGIRCAVSANNILIKFVEVHDGAYFGVEINTAPDITLEDMWIHDQASGTSTDAHGVYVSQASPRCTVRRCLIEDNAGDCLQSNGSAGNAPDDLLIEDCILQVSSGVAPCAEGALDLKYGNGIIIRRNLMQGFRRNSGACGGSGGSNAQAIVVQQEATNVEVYENIFRDISGPAIRISKVVNFHHNLIYDLVTEAAITTKHIFHFIGGANASIRNNTVVGSVGGQLFRATSNAAASVRNNIFEDTDVNSIDGTTSLSFDHNGWFNADEQETGTGDVTGTTAGFTNKTADDFTLTAGSPCIDAGVDLGYSYNGAAPDLGALEFGSGSGGFEEFSITEDIGASSDDARESNTGSMDLTNVELQFSTQVGRRIGWRFQTVAIPAGATIVSAVIRMVAAETDATGGGPVYTFRCEDVDDSTTFVNSSTNISGRTVTTAVSGDWTIPAITSGNTYDTVDFSSPLQEVIDRAGWATGQDINVIAECTSATGSTKDFHSYDSGSNFPQLRVTYQVPVANNPPTCNITAPTNGATISGTHTIQVQATDAEDSAGTLDVEVSIGGAAYQNTSWNSTPARYEYSFDTTAVPNGTYTIDARATDSDTATTQASQITVTVSNVDDPPTCAITDPVDDEEVTGTIVIQVQATDSEDTSGTLDVEVSIDGGAYLDMTWDSGDSRYERSLDTSTLTLGSHTIDARATDSGNNTTNAVQVTVVVPFTGGSAGTIDVKHNQMQLGDVVLLQSNGKIEYMQIDSTPSAISGGYRYDVIRNIDGTGPNQWYAGDAVLNTGQAGSGFIDLYSLESIHGRPPEYIFNYDAGGNAYSQNYTSLSRWTIFGDSANTGVNDAVYFGVANTKWQNLFFLISTAAVYTATLDWEFWNGSVWFPFTPTTSTDFKSTGAKQVLWDKNAHIGWSATTINSISAYWVRVRISAFTSWTTQPVQSGRYVYSEKAQIGPTIAFWKRNSNVFNDITSHGALGNMNGHYDYAVDVMGMAFGRYSPGYAWISADEVNGFRVMNWTTQKARWSNDGSLLIGQTGSGQGNLSISSVGQLEVREGTTTKIRLSTGGNVVIGSDVSNPSTRYIGIYSIASTFNGEAVSPGDMIIGDNTTGKANILWDFSEGRLKFRGGTTVQAYIDTSGSFVSGGGNVTMDSTGLRLTASSTTVFGTDEYPRAIRWLSGANEMMRLWSYETGGSPTGRFEVVAPSNETADIVIRSLATSVFSSSIHLQAVSGTTQSILSLLGGSDGLRFTATNHGFSLTYVTAVDDTPAITLVSNTTPDVANAGLALYSLEHSDGTSRSSSTAAISNGNNTDITVGAATMRFACNANGELTFFRTSGTGSVTGAILVLYF